MDNNKPLYGITPKLKKCNVAAANTATDGSGTLGTLFTSTKKTKCTKIFFKARVATTLGTIRLFISDSGGLNSEMFDEIIVPAVPSPGAGVLRASGYILYPDFQFEAGHVITVSTHNAESINVFGIFAELES